MRPGNGRRISKRRSTRRGQPGGQLSSSLIGERIAGDPRSLPSSSSSSLLIVDATWPRGVSTHTHTHIHTDKDRQTQTQIESTYIHGVREASIRRARRGAEGSERARKPTRRNSNSNSSARRVRREKGTPDSCCWYTVRPLRAFIARGCCPITSIDACSFIPCNNR